MLDPSFFFLGIVGNTIVDFVIQSKIQTLPIFASGDVNLRGAVLCCS